MSVPEPAPDLDLIAASLRADAGDTHTFLETLAVKLEDALPAGVSVTRRRSGLRGPKTVAAIAVDAGGDRLELERDGLALQARRARRSGGITLRTESLAVDAWLGALAEVLAEQARSSQQTRDALARVLGG